MLDKSTILKHYKRRDIQDALVEHARNKEIGTQYQGGFGKRPDSINYPRDVLEFALNGITSFHASEEIWRNPLKLSSTITKKELDELRAGWDLVLDIDCKVFEYSRLCANLVVKFLEYCEVENIGCKFSGNKGMHIAVPYEAFPTKVGEKLTKDLFPEAARKIAAYVTHNIKDELAKQILESEQGNINKIAEKVDLAREEILFYEQNHLGDKVAKLKVEQFLEIDTILIASRHLYRMPYSLHEKSGLVSLPIDPQKTMSFEKDMAVPDIIKVSSFKFIDRDVKTISAAKLLAQALDFEVQINQEQRKEQDQKYSEFVIESAIGEDFFPPCVKKILLGMEDGKKRGVFILTNFLGKIGWNKEQIEDFLNIWNNKNPQKFREVYIKSQLNHFEAGGKLPPNCDNEGYYKGLEVCLPDSLCARIKNPANYSILKWKRWLRDKEDSSLFDKEKKEEKKQPKADKNTA